MEVIAEMDIPYESRRSEPDLVIETKGNFLQQVLEDARRSLESDSVIPRRAKEKKYCRRKGTDLERRAT